MQDVELAVAFGRSRSDTAWKNEYLSWGELVTKLRTVRRTSETMDAYDQMSRPNKDKIKNGPAFVGGFVRGGRRKKENVQSRCLITLDADHADDDFLFMVDLILGGHAYVAYSTHSSRLEKQKYRVVAPTNRDCTPDEYAAAARKLAEQIGMRYFDKTTFDVHRLMYLPSCSADAEPIFVESEGSPVDVDALLAAYEDWTDPMQWARHPGEDAQRKAAKKMEDPREKQGIVGAFCRLYSISGAIETFISDVYEQAAVEDRYTYVGSSSFGGLVVYDEDTFAFSHHESDPISGREVNAFDLVRIHKFGSLDDNASEKTNITKLPSYTAMADMAAADPLVKKGIMAAIGEDFGDDLPASGAGEEAEDDWEARLDLHSKTGELLPTANNAELILSHGAFKDVLAYDAFGNTEVIRAALPWRKRERPTADYEPWLAADDARMLHFFGKRYKFYTGTRIQNAFKEVTHSNTFHPIKEYLEATEWDGEERVELLFHRYLGAPDGIYEREVTRKILIAACKRIYEPGCKFDEVVILVGPQGSHKSSILQRLGGKWFSDAIKNLDNKEAGEHLQKAWIVELAELSAMKRSEVEEVKAFLSKTEDRYRVAYDRVVSEFPRKCVFFGTSNPHDFLKDATGGRRFWPIVVDPEKRQLNHFDHMTDEVLAQIWAEALHYYRQGESIRLSAEVAEIAKQRQEDHMEVDTRMGLVQEYLEAPLPENWAAKNVYERREYLVSPTGSLPRKRVCAAEIWAECLNGEAEKMRPWEAKPILDMVRRLPEWVERKGRIKVPQYGLQTIFERVN